VPLGTVLFDGVCNLCNASVRIAIANDPGGRLRFASLESPAARAALAPFVREPGSFASIVLIDAAGLSEGSEAALRLACYLRWPWPLLGACFAVPRGVRDRVYAWIARNRYRAFGTSHRCPIPAPAIRDRFL